MTTYAISNVSKPEIISETESLMVIEVQVEIMRLSNSEVRKSLITRHIYEVILQKRNKSEIREQTNIVECDKG